jgi:hypothetical protein
MKGLQAPGMGQHLLNPNQNGFMQKRKESQNTLGSNPNSNLNSLGNFTI